MKTSKYFIRILFAIAWLMPGSSILIGGIAELVPKLRHVLEVISKYQANNVSFEDYERFGTDVSRVMAEIGPLIYQIPSPDWHPSAARRRVIAQIGAVISPYNKVLAELGFGGDGKSGALSSQCLSLLEYTTPDPILESTLRKYFDRAPNEKYGSTHLLIEHRMLNEVDIKMLLDRMENEKDLINRLELACILSKLRRPEVVPVMAEFLNKPVSMAGTGGGTGVNFTENESLGNISGISEAISFLGPIAKPLLPLLRQRMAEIATLVPEAEKQLYVIGLQCAIEQIEGRRELQIRMAVNGSGSVTDLLEPPPLTVPPLTPTSEPSVPSNRPASTGSK